MRALLVLTQPPLPEGGAPGKTAVGLLRGLRSHGVDVQTHGTTVTSVFAASGRIGAEAVAALA